MHGVVSDQVSRDAFLLSDFDRSSLFGVEENSCHSSVQRRRPVSPLGDLSLG